MFCLACGYPLDGLDVSRCPECGRPFDPRYLRSTTSARSMGRLARRVAGPTGWMVFSAAGLMCVGRLAMACHPESHDTAYALPVRVAAVVIVLYAARLAIRHLVLVRHGAPFAAADTEWRRRLWLIALLTLTGVMSSTRLPMRIGFLTARPGLEAMLRQLEAGTPASFDVLTNEIRGLGLNMQLEKRRI